MTKNIILLALLTACTSHHQDVEKCWNQSRLSQIREQMFTILKTSGETHQPKLVENTCRKKKYAIGERVLVINNMANGDVSARTYRESENPQGCMSRALNEIQKFSSPIDDNVIALHQQKYAAEWKDIDLSPVGWLNCSSDQLTFYDSLVTFLHELTHGLRKDDENCLYQAMGKKQLCFDLPKALPLRSFGKLKHFSTKMPEAIQGLAMVQQVYLTNTDQPFFMQLDELNAYILSNYNYLQVLKQSGPKNFIDNKGKRPGILMPLFYKITVTYLTRLKRENKVLYQQAFVENATNRAGLIELFDSVRSTYQLWKKQLLAAGLPEKDFEQALFREAESLEKALKL